MSGNYTAAAIIGTGALLVAAPGLVTVPVLAAVGFGSHGVIAGSLAAAAHSFIGNVAAGGLFATLQSAGAGGAGAAVVNGVAQGVGATAAGKKICSYFSDKSDEDDEDAEEETGLQEL